MLELRKDFSPTSVTTIPSTRSAMVTHRSTCRSCHRRIHLISRPQASGHAASEGCDAARIRTAHQAHRRSRPSSAPGFRRIIRGADVPATSPHCSILLNFGKDRRAASRRQCALQRRAGRGASLPTATARLSRLSQGSASTMSDCPAVFKRRGSSEGGRAGRQLTIRRNTVHLSRRL